MSKVNNRTSLMIENPEEKKLIKNKENGIVCIVYRLDKNLFEENTKIRLFGNKFFEKNKDKCKIIISEKEYEIVDVIELEKFEKYGINEKDEILEVVLKGESIDDISHMFNGCKNLIKVDFSEFKSQNVINMASMFEECTNLIKVDFSSFNTKNVIDMNGIFAGCENLVKIDLSSFNTQNVKNMMCMFSGCRSLIKIDFSTFNIKNETELFYIFNECGSLIKIKRKNFNKVKNASGLDESQLSKLYIVEI